MTLIKKGVYTNDGNFRKELNVSWESSSEKKDKAIVIGINPSKADDLKSDATITKLANFLNEKGYHEFLMLNIFQNYSTDQAGIDKNSKTDFKDYIDKFEEVDSIIVVWGVNNEKYTKEKNEILDFLKKYKDKVLCIEKGNGSKPLHPSRLSYEYNLVKYDF